MSAPDTNTEREAKRHSPALLGIFVAVIIAGIAGLVMTSWGEVENDATPSAQTVQPSN
ncbi:hypothetical protein [Pararhodobacter sp. CCB-MM2]|uniref:hypothetical protein n=1 Tax=Pararhodobacter sp. CCB-MM2 TaxID=1786003 RepID=UPI0013147D37|nr:hypothetical protein [Pararhodobacter sp. CCB-MM2]